MSKRKLNAIATVVIVAGVGMLSGAKPAQCEQACCYEACMKYCTPVNNFDYCHSKCNADCEAC